MNIYVYMIGKKTTIVKGRIKIRTRGEMPWKLRYNILLNITFEHEIVKNNQTRV